MDPARTLAVSLRAGSPDRLAGNQRPALPATA